MKGVTSYVALKGMRQIIIPIIVAAGFLFGIIISCQPPCGALELLQTIEMNLEVNADNLGVSSSSPQNSTDTIRSERAQFYNFPDFRIFGFLPDNRHNWMNEAYANDDCLEQKYVSRMDPDLTKFFIDSDYDAAAVGEGIVLAGTDLLAVQAIRSAYLSDFEVNAFLNGGAPAPLTISPNFFQPINQSWVTFHFSFTELDGTVFEDSAQAYIDMIF